MPPAAKPGPDHLFRQVVVAMLTGVVGARGTNYLTADTVTRVLTDARFVVKSVKEREAKQTGYEASQ